MVRRTRWRGHGLHDRHQPGHARHPVRLAPPRPDVGRHRRGRVHRAVGLGRAAGRPGLGGRLLLRPPRLPGAGRASTGLRAGDPRRSDAGRRDRVLGRVPRCLGDAAGRPGVRRHRGGRTHAAAVRWPGWSAWACPSARSRRPPTAAPTSSSPPAPPPICPACSTAWAGTTRTPSTCAASVPVRTSRRRPPTAAVSARCAGCAPRPGLGVQGAGGPPGAGHAGVCGAPVTGLTPYTAKRPTRRCIGAGASPCTSGFSEVLHVAGSELTPR